MLDQQFDDSSIEIELENAMLSTIVKNGEETPEEAKPPEVVDIFPLLRRPFFPGMAAPLMIEPGPFYETLKRLAKTKHKCVGLVLSKKEERDIYDLSIKDLHKVGVLARILRIIPMEKGGAQIILNMEKRLKIKKAFGDPKRLKAYVLYHEDKPSVNETLKAYTISIISTIKELLKLNPIFKEELQIFLSHSDFTEPGKIADFAVALTTARRGELQEVLETYDVEKRIEKALVDRKSVV